MSWEWIRSEIIRKTGEKCKINEIWSIVFTLCGAVAGYVGWRKKGGNRNIRNQRWIYWYGVYIYFGKSFYSKSDQRLSGRKREESYSFFIWTGNDEENRGRIKRWEIWSCIFFLCGRGRWTWIYSGWSGRTGFDHTKGPSIGSKGRNRSSGYNWIWLRIFYKEQWIKASDRQLFFKD